MKKLTAIDKTFTQNKRLISGLEQVLEDAKKGIVTSFVGVTERFNGATGEFVCFSDDGDTIKMLGALSLLMYGISKAITPDGHPS